MCDHPESAFATASRILLAEDGEDVELSREQLRELARLAHEAGEPSIAQLQAPGVMRIKVETRPGFPQFGVLLGLLLDEHGDTLAVVRLDHYGLMLKSVHPSCVVPVTPEEEEAHKP